MGKEGGITSMCCCCSIVAVSCWRERDLAFLERGVGFNAMDVEARFDDQLPPIEAGSTDLLSEEVICLSP